MYRGEHVDILYGNVKHAFFQVKLSLYFLAQIKFDCHSEALSSSHETI